MRGSRYADIHAVVKHGSSSARLSASETHYGTMRLMRDEHYVMPRLRRLLPRVMRSEEAFSWHECAPVQWLAFRYHYYTPTPEPPSIEFDLFSRLFFADARHFDHATSCRRQPSEIRAAMRHAGYMRRAAMPPAEDISHPSGRLPALRLLSRVVSRREEYKEEILADAAQRACAVRDIISFREQ